ncbi:hypothetical protein H5410_031276 [Solanum commersonii]|uniref:Uncharacterized protein n=1 Tax=Solanum commersonii TaxID=4109 RepID=A0A9J5YHX1_SOLCO|nr:hypothetical protein H5410_031276 [Solanum commersonii]
MLGRICSLNATCNHHCLLWLLMQKYHFAVVTNKPTDVRITGCLIEYLSGVPKRKPNFWRFLSL